MDRIFGGAGVGDGDDQIPACHHGGRHGLQMGIGETVDFFCDTHKCVAGFHGGQKTVTDAEKVKILGLFDHFDGAQKFGFRERRKRFCDGIGQSLGCLLGQNGNGIFAGDIAVGSSMDPNLFLEMLKDSFILKS